MPRPHEVMHRWRQAQAPGERRDHKVSDSRLLIYIRHGSILDKVYTVGHLPYNHIAYLPVDLITRIAYGTCMCAISAVVIRVDTATSINNRNRPLAQLWLCLHATCIFPNRRCTLERRRAGVHPFTCCKVGGLIAAVVRRSPYIFFDVNGAAHSLDRGAPVDLRPSHLRPQTSDHRTRSQDTKRLQSESVTLMSCSEGRRCFLLSEGCNF